MVEVEGGGEEWNPLYVDKSVYTVNDEPAQMVGTGSRGS